MAKAGMLIPVAVGAPDGVTNPLLHRSAEQLAHSTWHQNFFDQDLGPSVGRVVNDVSVDIVSGQMSPAGRRPADPGRLRAGSALNNTIAARGMPRAASIPCRKRDRDPS